MEFEYKDFVITNDLKKMDKKSVHDFLSEKSYWCQGIPLEVFEKSIENSLNFILMYKDKQIGFARIITDYATIAYLGDVYILSEYRGLGLSKWMMEVIMNHAQLQGLRRWILLTRDAHDLYKKFGWKSLADPDRWMELHNKNIYDSLESTQKK